MGEYAGYAMTSYYHRYGAQHGFPKGWMSEKHPCPYCSKGIAGREEGMRSHIRLKHGIKV